MRKLGLVAAMLVAGVMISPAMGASTMHLSLTDPDTLTSTQVPTIETPEVTLNVGETVTLYLWAAITSNTANSTAMGWSYVESNPAVVDAGPQDVYNPQINPDYDPEDPATGMYRWNEWNAKADFGALGWGAAGISDPSGLDAKGFTGSSIYLDPTKHLSGTIGTLNPAHFAIAEVTFTAAAAGDTNIFLTVNSTLMLGSSQMIGTTTPAMKIGAGEANAAPVSTVVQGGVTTYYIDSGVTGALPDAIIHVVPEPASLGLLALGGLALIRRR